MDGRAKRAEEYPDELCRHVCKGLKEQEEYDRSMLICTKSLNSLEISRLLADAGCPTNWRDDQREEGANDKTLGIEIALLRLKDGQEWAYDDVSGAVLDP